MHQVTLLGCPRTCGGANVEAGDTALLWRRAGWDVTVVPVWGPELPDNPWPDRLREAGCRYVEATPETLATVPGLADGLAVAFCSYSLLPSLRHLERLGVRLVWSPCMCYCTGAERKAFAGHPPAAVHFQSEFQRRKLAAVFLGLGVPLDRQHQIPGAFDAAAIAFHPCPRDSRRFTVGRLARAAWSKWSPDLWPTLEAVRRRGVPLDALCMGWSDELAKRCGKPPAWAECLPEDTVTTGDFLAECHALLGMNCGAQENWPRVGLEAMAAGVPVVAERAWGWMEMIEDGATGLLYDTPAEATEQLHRLATNDLLRMSITENARAAAERLADPDRITEAWSQLLWEVEHEAAGHLCHSA